MSTNQSRPVGGSFRDPSGYMFTLGDVLFRHIGTSYKAEYEHFISSGLYQHLHNRNLIIAHEEIDDPRPGGADAYRVLQPDLIPFISYPYEWSFSQLRDAALTTIDIARAALNYGMILKDASAYNIQFIGVRPVFIDTLSFAMYEEGRPWVAYRQFCQHFLAPLAVMSHTDRRLGMLLRDNIDGLPLDLAAKLLPFKTKLQFSLLTHIHLHAKSQSRYSDGETERKGTFSKKSLIGLMENLRSGVESCKMDVSKTTWSHYYDDTNYSSDASEQKASIVKKWIDETGPRIVWDLGANTGRYSNIAADSGAYTIAFDLDNMAVELCYRESKKKGSDHLLPLVCDLANPTPSIGWALKERDSLPSRGPADCILALALVHHLAIGNNVPLQEIAEFFSRVGNQLIIEFVPKCDSQVKRLLRSRIDIFDQYEIEAFETAFEEFYVIQQKEQIQHSDRVLYLMQRRGS